MTALLVVGVVPACRSAAVPQVAAAASGSSGATSSALRTASRTSSPADDVGSCSARNLRVSLAPIGAGLHHHLTLLRFTDVSGEPCWLAGQPALAIRAGGGRLDLRIDPVPARTSAEQAALQQQLSGYATAVPDGARLRLTASTPVLALLDIETYGDCDLREDIHDGQRWTVAGAHLRGSLELRGVSSDICSRSRVHVSPVLRQGRLAIPSRQFETPDQTSRP